ncbi:MAG: helix-turn-helix transcriptional regulator [Clostridia bacterium]|nr:helix-turn-helix transcriptional regulator [Clostridia bacterium]
MDNKIIGIKISKYMEEKDMSIKELANILDITQTTLKNKLQGNSKFYVSEIVKIKEALKLDLDTFEELFFNFK